MKKFHLPNLLDTLFITFCLFLLTFACVRFYTKSALWGLVVAIPMALAIGLFTYWMLTKRQQKKQLVFYTDKAKKNLALYLSILTDAELKNLLSPFVQNDEEGFFTFCIQPLQPDQILPTLRHQTPYKKVLFCNLLTDEAKNLCEMFRLETRNIEQIYKLLQQNDALPQSYPFVQPTKLSGLAKVKGRFNRKLCFPLFRCGVMLLFFSFITYYPVYYLVFGGMLLLASAVMLVFCKS